MDNKPTKEKGTKQLYLYRTINFIKKAYKESKEQNHELIQNAKNIYIHDFGTNNQIEGLTLLNTVIWACKYWANNLTQESWRAYRAPLKFTAELYLQSGIIDENTFKRIELALKKTKGVSKKELEPRTSAKKQKKLPIKDLKKIDNALAESKSIWSAPTRLWLRAGILTGLRPIEWRKAIIYEDKDNASLALIVQNAKNTNNRANGESRTLHLNHLSEDEKIIIKNFLKFVAKFKDKKSEWDSLYKGCSDLLRRKNKITFPNRKKHPTLYSSRHQFSANAKASGCKPEEIAALMGHASDLTAQMTYGKKINGTRGKKPEIEKKELSTVKKHKKTTKYFSIKNELEKNKIKGKNDNK